MVSDDYVMGFVEGEGCFSIIISRYKDYVPRKTTKRFNRTVKKASMYRIKPTFRICIENNDKYVLEKIKEKFGFGKIYICKRSQQGSNREDIAHYYVDKFESLYKLQELFAKQNY